jgi:hypothetical protein
VTFARVVDGEIDIVGTLPYSARRLDTGRIIHDLFDTNRKWRRACGWYEVIETARPVVSPLEVAEATVELVDGLPTQVWVVRPKTQSELDAANRAANRAELLAIAGSNIDALMAVVAELNVLTSLTNAEINANPAAHIKDVARSVKTCARQTVRIARVLTDMTDSIDVGD